MLLTVSISGATVSLVIAVVLIVVAVAAGFILLRSGVLSRQVGIDATAFAEAQTTMQRQQIDITHLQQLNAEKDVAISKLEAKVEVLEGIVTARDLITRGFLALGVPEQELR